MVDNDLTILDEAKDAAFAFDKAYRRALLNRDLDMAMELRPKVNEVYTALSSARMQLLDEGVLATGDDVAEMRRIKSEIDNAADRQRMITGAVKIVGFLGKFVP